MKKGSTSTGKNAWALFLLILAGIMLGGFLGQFAGRVSFLSWLNYGQTFGLNAPIILDIGILVLTFGIVIRFSVASVIGILLAILIYRLI